MSKKITRVLFASLFLVFSLFISSLSFNALEALELSDTERFLGNNPFFEYESNTNSLNGIYEGITTDVFRTYFNENLHFKFMHNMFSYEGEIRENTTVIIKKDDLTYTVNINKLEDIPISISSYNGTNFSLPLNKENLLSYITCGYGSYSNCEGGLTGNHTGMDFSYLNIYGSNIYAVDDGVVVGVYTGCESNKSWNCNNGWGNYIQLEHANGVRTYYGHLQKASTTLKVGQRVTKGSVIGRVGNSGSSTGSHLHFQITIYGQYVNPFLYLQNAPLPNGSINKYNITYQNGYYLPNRTVYVRNEPSWSSPHVAYYVSSMRIDYDAYIVINGYSWISYISDSGVRRYVAYKQGTGSNWGTLHLRDDFTRVPEVGYTFYPDRVINVRNHPSLSGTIAATYDPGEAVKYDSYVINDGHVWVSYISDSGVRRYVAWRVVNGEKFGIIK